MRRVSFSLRLVVLGGLIGLSGCSRKDPLSSDPKIATRQVNGVVPLGTSATSARRLFSDRGFQFSGLGGEATANSLIVGTYTTPETMWQVGFIIVDDKVAARTVGVTDLRTPAN